MTSWFYDRPDKADGSHNTEKTRRKRQRGSILSDLFLLVGGIAEITTPRDTSAFTVSTDEDDDGFHADEHLKLRQLEAGEFIGEIGFFTESPQVDSVACLTVCKTLTMPRSSYLLLAQDHLGSVGKILENLLAKVEEASLKLQLPKDLSLLRAGSTFDLEAEYILYQGYGSLNKNMMNSTRETDEIAEKQEALTSVKDLVKMHMSKQLDDQTTRLLFAASRGDSSTITLMCIHGFNPDNADYDSRTALMVASMKGNTEVVNLLLYYKVSYNEIVVPIHYPVAH